MARYISWVLLLGTSYRYLGVESTIRTGFWEKDFQKEKKTKFVARNVDEFEGSIDRIYS